MNPFLRKRKRRARSSGPREPRQLNWVCEEVTLPDGSTDRVWRVQQELPKREQRIIEEYDLGNALDLSQMIGDD